MSSQKNAVIDTSASFGERKVNERSLIRRGSMLQSSNVQRQEKYSIRSAFTNVAPLLTGILSVIVFAVASPADLPL